MIAVNEHLQPTQHYKSTWNTQTDFAYRSDIALIALIDTLWTFSNIQLPVLRDHIKKSIREVND